MTQQHRPNGTDYARGCRCDECKLANTRRANRRRSIRAAMRVEVDGVLHAVGKPHGVYSTYTNWGCRCDPCIESGRLGRMGYRRPDIGLDTQDGDE